MVPSDFVEKICRAATGRPPRPLTFTRGAGAVKEKMREKW
jgi:hypothetical protein